MASLGMEERNESMLPCAGQAIVNISAHNRQRNRCFMEDAIRSKGKESPIIAKECYDEENCMSRYRLKG
ncbi:MAG: hypothetical protein BGO55_00105 [Sphingobacteriales bacterium 50-39]|nr:MAG: hypothetical protein BGO55_00105 [Sphingobacteriales bacterium 50-39]